MEKKHARCQPVNPVDSSANCSAGPTDREQQLTSEIQTLKRKVRSAESDTELAKAKAAKHAAAQVKQSQSQRQDTLGEQRRLPIDPENKELLNVRDKSTAMASSGTGMIDTITYWARGSAAIVLQLIMSLIVHFGLQHKVAAELDLQLEEQVTNKCIVFRARDALQILKECDSEEQRREYRIVLTALLPELKKKGDPTGMQAKVAPALGVNRNRATFRESVARRAEIDKLAVAHAKELKVGDAVVCKRTPPGATTTLTALPAGMLCLLSLSVT